MLYKVGSIRLFTNVETLQEAWRYLSFELKIITFMSVGLRENNFLLQIPLKLVKGKFGFS